MDNQRNQFIPIVPLEEADMSVPPPFPAVRNQFRLTVNVEGNQGLFGTYVPPMYHPYPYTPFPPNVSVHPPMNNHFPLPCPLVPPMNHRPNQAPILNTQACLPAPYKLALPTVYRPSLPRTSTTVTEITSDNDSDSEAVQRVGQSTRTHSSVADLQCAAGPSSRLSKYEEYLQHAGQSSRTSNHENFLRSAGTSSCTSNENKRESPITRKPLTRSAAKKFEDSVQVKVKDTVPMKSDLKKKQKDSGPALKKFTDNNQMSAFKQQVKHYARDDSDSELPAKRFKNLFSDDESDDEVELEHPEQRTKTRIDDQDDGKDPEESSGRWMDRELSSEEDDSDFADDPAPKPLPPKDGPSTKSKKSLTLQKGSDAFRKQANSLLTWLEDEDAGSSKSSERDSAIGKNKKKNNNEESGPTFISESNIITISDEDTDEEEGMMIPNASKSLESSMRLSDSELKEPFVFPDSCYICFDTFIPGKTYLGVVQLLTDKCKHSPRGCFHCELNNIELYKKCGWCQQAAYDVSSVLYEKS